MHTDCTLCKQDQRITQHRVDISTLTFLQSTAYPTGRTTSYAIALYVARDP